MIAVIFEVEPRPGRRQDYLDIAGELKPLLEASTASSPSSGSRA
jgi:hypothetical protein